MSPPLKGPPTAAATSSASASMVELKARERAELNVKFEVLRCWGRGGDPGTFTVAQLQLTDLVRRQTDSSARALTGFESFQPSVRGQVPESNCMPKHQTPAVVSKPYVLWRRL
jgi:hypothetical protein